MNKIQYNIRITKQANEDLEKIFDFLFENTLNLDFANNFILDMYLHIKNSLIYMPKKFPLYKNNIRKIVYPKNKNYVIFFEINDIKKEIFITAFTNIKQYTRYNNM